jgi:hypothetical protein
MIFLAECQIECDARTSMQLMQSDASLLMCKTIRLIIGASFVVLRFYHFAGEKCVFPHYIESLGESLGADNLFSTGIMRISRQDSHGVNAPQALGSRCIHCRGEFGSRVAMACHRRHPASIGTPSEDPKRPSPFHIQDVPMCHLPLFWNMLP